MDNEKARDIRNSEGREAKMRYELVNQILTKQLEKTALIEEKPFCAEDVEAVKRTIVAVAPIVHGRIYPNYWDHLLLTSIYAQKLAEKTDIENLSPKEAQCLALLHDLGRMVVPHRYLRTDLVGQRLIQRIGIRKELWEKQAPVPSILGRGKPVKDINDLSSAQRLMDVADNLGKRNQDGTLFNEEQMKDYNSSQTERYKEVAWSSERFGISALETGKQKFAISLVKDEIEWFKNKGIDFKKLRQEVEDEFKKPENQEWLFAVKEAQETFAAGE